MEGRLEVVTYRKRSRFGIDGIISMSFSTLVWSIVGSRPCTAISRTSLDWGPMLRFKYWRWSRDELKSSLIKRYSHGVAAMLICFDTRQSEARSLGAPTS